MCCEFASDVLFLWWIIELVGSIVELVGSIVLPFWHKWIMKIYSFILEKKLRKKIVESSFIHEDLYM